MFSSVRLAEVDFEVVPLNRCSLLLRPQRKPDDALLLPLLGQQIHDRAVAEVAEVIATTTELCLVAVDDRQRMLQHLAEAELLAATDAPSRQIELPVSFDPGAHEDAPDEDDWGEVCRQTGFNRDTYIERLCAARLRVAMFGFLPGFVYLTGLPAELMCGRKSDPSVSVPAGSFAVGGPYAGVYGLSSPAGWQVIGRTPIDLADPRREPPLRLRIGDRLDVQPIDPDEFQALATDPPTLESLSTLDDDE